MVLTPPSAPLSRTRGRGERGEGGHPNPRLTLRTKSCGAASELSYAANFGYSTIAVTC